VQQVTSRDQVAGYVAKYVAKPGSATVYRDPDRLQELLSALHGRRLLLCFGDCSLPDEETDESPHQWKNVARLSDILRDAAAGVPTALALAAIIGVLQPCKPKHPPPIPLKFSPG